MLPTRVRTRDGDAQDDGSRVIGQLLGLLLDAGQDSMDQNDAAVCLIDPFFILEQPAQGKPLPIRRSNHGRDLHEEPLAAQAAFEVSGSGLRFRQKDDPGTDPDQLGRQLQLGESGLSHAVVVMSEAPDETGEPQMARLVSAMLAERRPPVLQIPGEAEFLPLPGLKWLAMPVTQMSDESERLSRTKPWHGGSS